MNRFTFTGRLTAEPEHKMVGENDLTKFSIAVGREMSKEVDFMDITTWRKTAKNCASYLSKGSHVLVEGRIEKRSYESKEGKKMTVIDFIGERVEFLNRIEKKQDVIDDDLPFG
jgi:single-strand DNA-binding protein